jgi:riboflavin kinase/FMN adenylyltransferase
MRVINWGDSPVTDKKTALTIGVFDGVHRGHRALIQKITAQAPRLIPAILTFRENPKKELRSWGIGDGIFDGDIISFDEKIELFKGYGVELCMIIDFTRDFSIMGGRLFFEEICAHLNPGYAVIGSNFHCGYGRDTGAAAFTALAAGKGIQAEIIEPVFEGGLPVSSSRIRAALRAGRIEEAGLLLGRPYTPIQADRIRFQGV